MRHPLQLKRLVRAPLHLFIRPSSLKPLADARKIRRQRPRCHNDEVPDAEDESEAEDAEGEVGGGADFKRSGDVSETGWGSGY